jgi:HSP20 family molecular chaperone IbpA
MVTLESLAFGEHISHVAADGARWAVGDRAAFRRAKLMSRMPGFSSPLLLGFDEVERLLDRVAKTPGDGYPPYNIERLPPQSGKVDRLRITLAVAGFSRDELEVTLEENQLTIKGRQGDDEERAFLHRGIAARQFQRAFVLAEGMEVKGAALTNGLLAIDLERPEPQRVIRRIEIKGV